MAGLPGLPHPFGISEIGEGAASSTASQFLGSHSHAMRGGAPPRYALEPRGCGLFANHAYYSVTTSLPFIFPCPTPQKWEHSNGKVPTLSAVNSSVVGVPFFNLWLILKASNLNP